MYIELASLEVLMEMLCHVMYLSSRYPMNFICSESLGVSVRLIIVLFSTNEFSVISGIFGDELNTTFIVGHV